MTDGSNTVEIERFHLHMQLRDLKDHLAYWEERLNRSRTAGTVLDGTSNGFGGLSLELRQRILAFLNRPCADTWDECYPILVTPDDTLWQVWVQCDPCAPRGKRFDAPWTVWPPTDKLLGWIRDTVDADRTRALARVHRLQGRILSVRQRLLQLRGLDSRRLLQSC